MKTSPRIMILAALAAGLALASCADSQPTRFYTLAPLQDAPDAAMPATPYCASCQSAHEQLSSPSRH